eukprot:720909-Rhodomonas_salina.1
MFGIVCQSAYCTIADVYPGTRVGIPTRLLKARYKETGPRGLRPPECDGRLSFSQPCPDPFRTRCISPA